MKTGIKKLVLTKETLRAVADPRLAEVNGGGISQPDPRFGGGSGCAWSHGGGWASAAGERPPMYCND